MLLASIPPDQYLDFERLRRENSAKAIQRNYRAVLQQRNRGECVSLLIEFLLLPIYS